MKEDHDFVKNGNTNGENVATTAAFSAATRATTTTADLRDAGSGAYATARLNSLVVLVTDRQLRMASFW